MDMTTADLATAEDAYCEARARCYVGAGRVRAVCDNEVELWLKHERAAVRAELETQFASLFECGRALAIATERAEAAVRALEHFAGGSTGHAVDELTLVAKASAVVELWGDDWLALDLDADGMSGAMAELAAALEPFERIDSR